MKFYRRRAFWRNFIPSFGFLYIVPTQLPRLWSKISPPRTIGILSRRLFRSEIYFARARFNRRLFIAKRLLEIKLVAIIPPGFYLFSTEP